MWDIGWTLNLSDPLLIGAAIGGLVTTTTAILGGIPWELVIPVAFGCFVLGVIFGLRRATRLNDAYLSRAMQCLERGQYKEAIEDAQEVARSSERLRSSANRVLNAARELRD